MEKDIENKFCDWVEEVYFIETIKLNVTGNRGWPDRVLICPRGIVVWIEFKDKGKTSGKRIGEKLQAYRHAYLRKQKHVIKIFDTTEEAKEWFTEFAKNNF